MVLDARGTTLGALWSATAWNMIFRLFDIEFLSQWLNTVHRCVLLEDEMCKMIGLGSQAGKRQKIIWYNITNETNSIKKLYPSPPLSLQH
jgi:hypothetical protein